jgi:hypothetical protein
MRVSSCLFVGAALLVAGSAACFSLIQRGRAPDFSPQLAAPTGFQVVAADEEGLRHLQAKGVVTRRLIAGELTLLEAAEWFRYLDDAMPASRTVPAPQDVGLSGDERYCREAIRWARAAAAESSPTQGRVVVERLEAELDAHLKPNGGPVLPEDQQ